MKHSLAIALVDSIWNGHHPTYIKIMSKILIESGHTVVVFCPCPEEINEWATQDIPSSVLDRIYTCLFEQPPKINFPIRRLYQSVIGINRWRTLSNTIKEFEKAKQIHCDLIFFAFLDTYLVPYLTSPMVDILFPHKWSGLYFQPFHFRFPKKYRYLRHCFFDPSAIIHSFRCPVIATLDEGITDKLEKSFNKPVIIFPDFTDSTLPSEPLNDELVNTIRTKSEGRKIIGLIGSLEKRKGILTLISVANKMKYEDYYFIFVGKLHEQTFSADEMLTISTFFDSHPANSYFHFSRIPDEKSFNNLIQASDILFAAYENFYGSSNILTKAGFFERPVIVSKGFCMGERVQKYNIGTCITSGSVNECVDAIHFLSDSTWYSEFPPDYEGLRKEHSISALSQGFQTLLNYV